MGDQKDVSLTATTADQLVELGTAADFGFCQSNRKVMPAPLSQGRGSSLSQRVVTPSRTSRLPALLCQGSGSRQS